MFSRVFRRSTIPPARSAGRLVKPNVSEPAAKEIFHEKPKFLFATFSLALFDRFQEKQTNLLPFFYFRLSIPGNNAENGCFCIFPITENGSLKKFFRCAAQPGRGPPDPPTARKSARQRALNFRKFSHVDFVSFSKIQSNHALPRGGGIYGNAHMRKTRFARLKWPFFVCRLRFLS